MSFFSVIQVMVSNSYYSVTLHLPKHCIIWAKSYGRKSDIAFLFSSRIKSRCLDSTQRSVSSATPFPSPTLPQTSFGLGYTKILCTFPLQGLEDPGRCWFFSLETSYPSFAHLVSSHFLCLILNVTSQSGFPSPSI